MWGGNLNTRGIEGLRVTEENRWDVTNDSYHRLRGSPNVRGVAVTRADTRVLVVKTRDRRRIPT